MFSLTTQSRTIWTVTITANQPFGEWNKVFPDPAMTIAAIDRLVHHSVVVEMNVESYRQRAATARKRRTAPKPLRHRIRAAKLGPDLTNNGNHRLPAAIWRDNHQANR